MSKENTLPTKVTDPFRFAENATRLQGKLLIKNMERLCTSLHSDRGEVSVEMHFGKDEQGISFINGHYVTCVSLQCQRCLEAFQFNLTNDFLLGIVRTEEEADGLPENYDPVMATEENGLIIQDVIEDELLISLPIVPVHDRKECKITLPLTAKTEGAEEITKENPFKVIELLRSKPNSK